jgi:hypothetical protein
MEELVEANHFLCSGLMIWKFLIFHFQNSRL